MNDERPDFANPDDQWWSPEMVEYFLEYLRDKRCARCGVLWPDHQDADHVWYEFAADIPDAENN